MHGGDARGTGQGPSGFPRVMRLVVWLDRPAASFTVFKVLRSP